MQSIKKTLMLCSIIVCSAYQIFAMERPRGIKFLHDITNAGELSEILSHRRYARMVTAPNNEGLLPIHVAARENRLSVVQYFVLGTIEFEALSILGNARAFKGKYWNLVSVDQADSTGMTVLFHAVQGGAQNVINFLLGHDARVDRLDNAQRSILHVVPTGTIAQLIFDKCLGSTQSTVLEQLVNQADAQGNTPLAHAATHNRDDVVAVLLRYGARIADTSNISIVRSLNRIFQSCEPESRMMLGVMLNELPLVQDALEDCRMHGARASGLARFASNVANSFTGRSATQHLANAEFLGIRPLVAAFQQGNVHIAALLIREGADYSDNVCDHFERTLTQIAAENEAMRAFLENVRRYTDIVDRAAYLDTVISQYAPFIDVQRRGQAPIVRSVNPSVAASQP